MKQTRVILNVILISLLFAVCASLSGCGYTFQGDGSVLPPDVRRIYIPTSGNDSTESGLGILLTEAIRDRFERYGVITVVEDISEADAVLRSKIVNVERNTSSVTSKSETSVAFDITLTVAAELKRINGTLLWRNDGFSVTKAYGAASDVVVTSSSDFLSGSLSASDLNALSATGSREVARSQENDALSNLADKAAKIIYDSAVAPDF